ncbi:MAG: hypothetical protein AB1749_02950 [Pseudomonadota bacterium]
MGIDQTSIAVGKCYVTADGQIRKVLKMDGGDVLYAHHKEPASKDWGRWKWLSEPLFAAQAVREVACD